MSTLAHSALEVPRGALTYEDLSAVLAHRKTLVHLYGAVDRSDCSKILNAIDGIAFERYAATDGLAESEPVSKLSTTATLFDYYDDPGEFDAYFEQAKSQMAFMRRRYSAAGSPDPLHLIIALLQQAWDGPVTVAFEPGRGTYNAAVVRSIPSGALPHVDRAEEEVPGLAVGEIVAQGSILIYLTGPSAGGALRVYDKVPSAQDSEHNRQDWGFSPAAIAGVPFAGVAPAQGDVVIFPTTLIHSVDPVIAGERISVSAFFGQTQDGRLILWS